jgi:hypothetical protein
VDPDRERVPLGLHGLARRVGLPAGWLREQALAGRLPCLRVGRRLLFDLAAVQRALAALAAGEEVISAR